MKAYRFLFCAFVLAGLLACVSSGTIVRFDGITNNTGYVTVGESQLLVSVDPTGLTNQVFFTFQNVGIVGCAVAEIYFHDGSLLAGAEIINGNGVNFLEFGNVSPSDLPGGNNVGFVAIKKFSVEPKNPDTNWGINPGEQLGLKYTLQTGRTYQHVIDELTNRELRIGIHLKAVNGGGSESYVNLPIPEPLMVLILAAGALFIRRK